MCPELAEMRQCLGERAKKKKKKKKNQTKTKNKKPPKTKNKVGWEEKRTKKEREEGAK